MPTLPDCVTKKPKADLDMIVSAFRIESDAIDGGLKGGVYELDGGILERAGGRTSLHTWDYPMSVDSEFPRLTR